MIFLQFFTLFIYYFYWPEQKDKLEDMVCNGLAATVAATVAATITAIDGAVTKVSGGSELVRAIRANALQPPAGVALAWPAQTLIKRAK